MSGLLRRHPGVWHLILIPASLLMIIPFVWMLDTAFMSTGEINRFPPVLYPSSPTVSGFKTVLSNSEFPRWFLNSSIVTGICVVSNVLLCSAAGYAFARMRFWLAGTTLVLLAATQLIPLQLTMIPMFILFTRLGLINTLGALFVPYLSTALGVILMRQFFVNFPIELEEAARIDGCTRIGTFVKIVLPLARPGIAAVAMLTFLSVWNDFLWPLVAITDASQMTLQVGLTTFQGQHHVEWSAVMAGNVITTFPVLIVFLIGQKAFVRAVTGSGIKG